MMVERMIEIYFSMSMLKKINVYVFIIRKMET